MGWMQGIGAFFSAIGSFFGWAKQRDAELNTPEMQANQKAKKQAKEDDEIQRENQNQDSDAAARRIAR